jgi:phage tail sheath gpL-like
MKGPDSPWHFACELAAQVAASASIDPARPFHTLKLKVRPPKVAERFTKAERNQLLYSGISTFSVDASGSVLVEGVVTTYKENAFGAPDESYLYLNSSLTLSYLRFDWRATVTSKYPRHKLKSDGGPRPAPGQAIITPNLMKAELIAKFREWEEKGLVENFDQFKNDLVVERNIDNPNRLDILASPDLVNQLIVVANKIAYKL